ncbi:hypothetical protein AAY473_032469 [Plecturocebus cupreus]
MKSSLPLSPGWSEWQDPLPPGFKQFSYYVQGLQIFLGWKNTFNRYEQEALNLREKMHFKS